MAIETSIVETKVKEVAETKKPAYKVVVPEFHDISYNPPLIVRRGQDISKLSEEKIQEYLAAGAIQKNED